MVEEVTMKNTKKEMLDIINDMQKKLDEKEKTKLNPEKIKEKTRKNGIIEKADKIISLDLNTQIHNLKISINKELAGLSEKIEAEADKYENLLQAIKLKQTEVNEIYGIEKEAAELAAIIEAQNHANQKFTAEMTEKRENLTQELDDKRFKKENELKTIQIKLEAEISDTRAKWEKEKKVHLESVKQENDKIKNDRAREKEEYEYTLKRNREIEKNKFSDEMEKINKEIIQKEEEFEKFQQTKTKELEERESKVEDREQKMEQLQTKVDLFPSELEKAVDLASKQTKDRLTDLFKQKEALLIKGFEGENNVLKAKIVALETITKDQNKQIEKLNIQQEKAYLQVQEIANKAVSGASERPQNITVRSGETEKTS